MKPSSRQNSEPDSTFMVKLLTIIIASLATACAAADEPNAFAVNKLIGRGVNIGNALEAPSEGEWGVTLQEEYFQKIKDAGFDSIRLPVRWNAHVSNEPPYVIEPNFFKRIDWAIQNSLSRNLPVVLTTHHYNELYNDPAGQKERFLAIWKQIAEHYKNYPHILVFEPLNEPHDNLNADEWNSLVKEVLAVIRQSNPKRTVVFGAINYNDIRRLNTLDLPKDDRNIIVTAHYYLPYEFTHQGAHWAADSNAWMGTKWTGSEDEKQRIAKDFDIAAEWGKKNNRPIYLNEFGVYEKADMESRARYTKFVADAAIERGFSFHYWQFDSDFAVYDIEKKTCIKPLLDALLAPR